MVTATDRLASSRPQRPPGLLAAWLLTVAILAAAGVAAVTWRAGIMRTWPPSSHILAMFDGMAAKTARMPGKNPQ
jgi:hypothetical protein